MGQVAIVTGGGGSMGSVIGLQLAREGYDVVLTDLRESAASAAADQVREAGRTALVIPADVRSPEQAQRVAKETLARFGQIDVLVNTAGGHIRLGQRQASEETSAAEWTVDRLPKILFHETSPEEWDVEMGVNLMGTLSFTYAVTPHMIARRSGVIINISSGHGLKGMATMAVYAAAKAGIIAFTRSIAVELGPYGIRVNCVAPGWTITSWEAFSDEAISRIAETVPLRQMTRPQDIANAIAFLVSPRASHITGVCLSVSGGQTLH